MNEPLEYWTVAEGWVKIDEVREHFDSVGCGTIYKHEGEGRVPLYPKREWVGLTESEMGQFIHDHCQQTDKTYRSLMDFASMLNDCLIRKNT
jgi:hypothetical protein